MKALPPEPEKPSTEDCCGGACSPCIWDIYYEKLATWRDAQKALKEKNADKFPFRQNE